MAAYRFIHTMSAYEIEQIAASVEAGEVLGEYTLNKLQEQIPQDGDVAGEGERSTYGFWRIIPETVGRTIKLYVDHFYHDGLSDYSGKVHYVNDDGSVGYTYTRGSSDYRPSDDYFFGPSTCDVSDELRARYDAIEAAKALAKAKQEAEYAWQEEQASFYTIAKGDWVYVSRGRKCKGASGKVFWIGENKWGPSLGFNDDKGVTHWTNPSNCDCVPCVEELD